MAISGSTTSLTGAPSHEPTMQAVSIKVQIRFTFSSASDRFSIVIVRGDSATHANGSIIDRSSSPF